MSAEVLSPNNLFAIDHLLAIPSGKLNSALNLLILSLVFLFKCTLYKYEFFKIFYCMAKMKCDDIHCWKHLRRHSAQFSVAYFTKIIFLLHH